MKELDLTTWERARLSGIIKVINSPLAATRQPCDIGKLREYLRLLNVLELTEEEKVIVGWITLATGQATWTSTDHIFNLSFEDADFALLLKTATKYTEWSPSEGELASAMMEKLEA